MLIENIRVADHERHDNAWAIVLADVPGDGDRRPFDRRAHIERDLPQSMIPPGAFRPWWRENALNPLGQHRSKKGPFNFTEQRPVVARSDIT